jgi:hypothetical protein
MAGGSIKYVASQQKGTPVDLVQKLAGYWLRGPDAERDADEGIGLLKGDQDVEQQSLTQASRSRQADSGTTARLRQRGQ